MDIQQNVKSLVHLVSNDSLYVINAVDEFQNNSGFIVSCGCYTSLS